LKAGDVLFTIDPTPYRRVKALEPQLKFVQLRLSQMTQLYKRAPAALSTSRQASLKLTIGRPLEGAQWNLDKTTCGTCRRSM